MTTAEVAAAVEKVTSKRSERVQQIAGAVWVRQHDGARYAKVASRSQPGHYWKVTGKGCECPGHRNHGYCAHFDYVMARLQQRLVAKAAAPRPEPAGCPRRELAAAMSDLGYSDEAA